MVTGLILGGLWNIGIYASPFHFIMWRKTDYSMLFFNIDLHRSGWGRWCFTCPVSVLPFCFFFVFLLGRSLSKQLPSLPALSLHQNRPPPISSCEKAQFCLSLPKRKHIMKCKPVAPPETTGLLVDCSVVTILVINTLSPPRKVKKKKDKKSWMKMFARHNCCIHIAWD